MKKQHIFILLLCLAATMLLTACGGLDQSIWTPDPVEEIEIDTEISLGLIPGVYAGVGEGGFGGDIYVEVTIDENGRIDAIEVTDHAETASFLMMASAQTTMQIIATQTTGVDTVAGATYSSQAIINAVENALADVAGIDLASLQGN